MCTSTQKFKNNIKTETKAPEQTHLASVVIYAVSLTVLTSNSTPRLGHNTIFHTSVKQPLHTKATEIYKT